MTELEPVAWPPSPIRTEQLVLRKSEARDRAALIELFASPEVGTYLGGPRPRHELERTLPETPGRRPGLFVVDLDGAVIGTIELNRRDAERRGHVRPDAGEAELGYMFLPEAWECGYAAEACAAALDWFADAHPGEPVVLCTQTANARSMRLAAKLGFTEVERYEAWGAEQWMGARSRSRRPLEIVPGSTTDLRGRRSVIGLNTWLDLVEPLLYFSPTFRACAPGRELPTLSNDSVLALLADGRVPGSEDVIPGDFSQVVVAAAPLWQHRLDLSQAGPCHLPGARPGSRATVEESADPGFDGAVDARAIPSSSRSSHWPPAGARSPVNKPRGSNFGSPHDGKPADPQGREGLGVPDRLTFAVTGQHWDQGSVPADLGA